MFDFIRNKNEKYYKIYTITKGDNLYSIAKRYNINLKLLAAINGIDEKDYIYPEQKILIPSNEYDYYITKEGDTIDIVSSILNTTPENVINNNTIYLKEGQLIIKK